MLSFTEWLLENSHNSQELVSIYEKIANSTGGKGLPMGVFTGEYLRQRAGLNDMEIRSAITSGLLDQVEGGYSVNGLMTSQLGKQFGFNPNVPNWLRNRV